MFLQHGKENCCPHSAALGILRDRAPERLRAGAVRRWDAHGKRLILLGGDDEAPAAASGDVGAQ